LHFTGLLLGSRILFAQTLCVLLAGIALTCTFLGAFAPISAFFLFSGSSYEFLLLLHVGIFACCGTVGLISVKQNMVGISWLLCNRSPQDDSEADWKNVANFPDVGMEHAQHRTSKLLMLWFLLYMFIGSQTAFLLSPFVGREQQFMLFASDKGDFFSYVLKTFGDLLR
jgi:hypothetical protein